MGREFEPLRVELTNINIDLNTTSTRDHVPDIDIHISIVKDRARTCHHTLTFNHIPKFILVAMLMKCLLWLNMLPPKGGVYASVIPRTILTGVKFDYNKHCRLQFEQYAQVQQ